MPMTRDESDWPATVQKLSQSGDAQEPRRPMTRDELVAELEKLADKWLRKTFVTTKVTPYAVGVADGYNQCLRDLEPIIAKAKEA